MKKIIFAMAALAAVVLGVASPAMAGNAFIIGRGTDVSDGIMYVTYTRNGDLDRISRADLAALGIDIFNQSAVEDHLGMRWTAGGSSATPGVDGIWDTPDDVPAEKDRW